MVLSGPGPAPDVPVWCQLPHRKKAGDRREENVGGRKGKRRVGVAPSPEEAPGQEKTRHLPSPCPCPVSCTDSSVGADKEQGTVWTVGGEAKDGGMEVLVVACQVDEGDHLGATFTDLFCCP